MNGTKLKAEDLLPEAAGLLTAIQGTSVKRLYDI